MTRLHWLNRSALIGTLAGLLATPGLLGAHAQTSPQTSDPAGMPVTYVTEDGTTTVTPRADGVEIRFEDARGVVTTKHHDAQGRLIREDAPETGGRTHAYDADGRLVRTETPDGLVTRLSYDAQGRLTRSTVRQN
ncbi:MAG: RHS repeat domain-containing protein, partial [Litorimonas sp.]